MLLPTRDVKVPRTKPPGNPPTEGPLGANRRGESDTQDGDDAEQSNGPDEPMGQTYCV